MTQSNEYERLNNKYTIISIIVIAVALLTLYLVISNPSNASRLRYPYKYTNDTTLIQRNNDDS